MPSSLVFAALVLAWIVVLVPMVARRRQEVRRTADSALAARVLRRGAAASARARPEEVPAMPDDADQDGYERPPAERRYRPGRGGFDPYAAELAARARYAFRQRVVFGLLLTALASGLLAGFAMPVLWWLHGGVDLLLVCYLGYLRRQVRIEQQIRRRRLERARTRRAIESGRPQPDAPRTHDTQPELPAQPNPDAPAHQEPPEHHAPRRATPPGTAIVDLDDEDPAFHDFDGDPPAPYRRAAGE